MGSSPLHLNIFVQSIGIVSEEDMRILYIIALKFSSHDASIALHKKLFISAVSISLSQMELMECNLFVKRTQPVINGEHVNAFSTYIGSSECREQDSTTILMI